MNREGLCLPTLAAIAAVAWGLRASHGGIPDAGTMSSAVDFRDALFEAQMDTLPAQHASRVQKGDFVFIPDGTEFSDAMGAALGAAPDGLELVVREDTADGAAAVETIDGTCVARVQAPPDYTAYWPLLLLATNGIPAGFSACDYDPSLVEISLTLHAAPPVIFLDGDPDGVPGEVLESATGFSTPLDGVGGEVEAVPAASSALIPLDLSASFSQTNAQSTVAVPDLSHSRVLIEAEETGGGPPQLRPTLETIPERVAMVVLHGGEYSGGLDVRGENLLVRVLGCVSFAEPEIAVGPAASPSEPVFYEPAVHAPTGIVSTVSGTM